MRYAETGFPALCLLAELQRLFCEPFPFGELTVEDGRGRAHCDVVPLQRGLLQLLRERSVVIRRPFDGCNVAERQRQPPAQPAGIESSLRLSGLLCQPGDLLGDRRQLSQLGPPGCREEACEGVPERVRVTEAARDLDRLTAERRSRLERGLVAKGSRQACEQFHSQHRLGLAQSFERFFEQRDKPGIASGAENGNLPP